MMRMPRTAVVGYLRAVDPDTVPEWVQYLDEYAECAGLVVREVLREEPGGTGATVNTAAVMSSTVDPMGFTVGRSGVCPVSGQCPETGPDTVRTLTGRGSARTRLGSARRLVTAELAARATSAHCPPHDLRRSFVGGHAASAARGDPALAQPTGAAGAETSLAVGHTSATRSVAAPRCTLQCCATLKSPRAASTSRSAPRQR